MKSKGGNSWQTRPEAGSKLGIRFLMWIGKTLGRRVLRSCLYPVAAYFFIVRGPERKASRDYLTRVFGRQATNREIFKHILKFSQVIADRFLFLADRAQDIPVNFIVSDEMKVLLKGGRAGVVLAAHFGSFDITRLLGPKLGGVTLQIVLDKAVNKRLLQLMEELQPDLSDKIIDSNQDVITLGLAIGDALKRGNWIGFLADRSRTGDRAMQHNFLNSPAMFPTGPYVIASTFKAPIVCVFCHVTDKGYEVFCEVLSNEVALDRKNRQADLNMLLGQYVELLEKHVQACPYAWFNFFDFWDISK